MNAAEKNQALAPLRKARVTPKHPSTLKGRVLFFKAEVKGHLRRLSNGTIVTVKPYANQRQKQHQAASPTVSDSDPRCSRYSITSRLPKRPMTVTEVQHVVDEFKSRLLPGNTALAFRVYATAEDAFGPAIAKYGRVQGAYLPQQRLFALAASHLFDRRDVEATLRHEVLAHYGLNLFAPETKRALLERLHASQGNPFIARMYRAVRHDYPGMNDPMLLAEEVFARVAERPPTQRVQAWDRLIVDMARCLRRMGFLQSHVTVAELRQTVGALAEGIRRGAPQRTFPISNQTQFRWADRSRSRQTAQGAERQSLRKAQPSPAQIEAGNSKKHHRSFQGLRIRIENLKGSVRTGIDPNGKPWQIQMKNHYGYIRGSQGVDKDHVDCYIGPNPDASHAYVVHQRQAGQWSRYDEDKVMLGFDSARAAKTAYLVHYNDPRFFGGMTSMPMIEFKEKVRATARKPRMIKSVVVFSKARHFKKDPRSEIEMPAGERVNEATQRITPTGGHSDQVQLEPTLNTTDADIWQPHHDPWQRDSIEAVTQRGLTRLDAIRDALSRALREARGEASGEVTEEEPLDKADTPWLRWSKANFDRVRAYLDAKPRAEYSLDDWLLSVDWLIQEYLPESVIAREAEYLTVRAHIAGKIRATLEARRLTPSHVSGILAVLPQQLSHIPHGVLSEREAHILRFANREAANLITALTDQTRQQMKGVLINGIRRITLGDRQGTWQKLHGEVLDAFGDLNRDWRRIAITETGNATNVGYLSTFKPGSRVKREEAYVGACPFCQSIRGRILTVVADDHEPKNWETEVWPSKNNVGRSASPRKRVGGALIPRTPDELWRIPAGVVHPHCFISPQVPIYTSTGWKPIGKVSIGDQVLTHQGRFRPVNWVLNNPIYAGDVIKLTVAFNGKNAIPLSVMTPEHPVLTDLGWVSAKSLKIGDSLVCLAKTCPTCGDEFINLKHDHVLYCSIKCSPRPGINQFSTDNHQQYADAVLKTSLGNRQRMRGLTIEQRQRLTAKGRKVMEQRGYAHLAPAAIHQKGNRSAALTNYAPNEAEQQIAERLYQLGQNAELQYRTPKLTPDCLGRRRYWFLDIALPEQKIAVEIDGDYWHPRQRDEERDADLQQQGWTVLRFDMKEAHQSPEKLADEICRLAMNHSQEYRFATVQITQIQTRHVKKARLYNFGVEEDESYIINGGVVVHNCRGSWSSADHLPGMSHEYQLWLRGLLREAGLPATA